MTTPRARPSLSPARTSRLSGLWAADEVWVAGRQDGQGLWQRGAGRGARRPRQVSDRGRLAVSCSSGRHVPGSGVSLSLLVPSSPPAFTSSPEDVFVWLEGAALTHGADKHQEPAEAILEMTLFRNLNRA